MFMVPGLIGVLVINTLSRARIRRSGKPSQIEKQENLAVIETFNEVNEQVGRRSFI